MSICVMTDNVDSDHLGKVASARILYCKVSIFLFSVTQCFGECNGF